MVLTKIGQTLQNRARKSSKANILSASTVCYFALQISDGLFVPLCFKNGTLFIKTQNPSASSNIMLSQVEIIKKINDKVGNNLVKKIKIKPY